MRNFGLALAFVGGCGYFYCTSELESLEPIPPSASLEEAVRFYPRGRYELARFTGAGAVVIGLLMAAVAKGR
jgi:hypothetical protein